MLTACKVTAMEVKNLSAAYYGILICYRISWLIRFRHLPYYFHFYRPAFFARSFRIPCNFNDPKFCSAL